MSIASTTLSKTPLQEKLRQYAFITVFCFFYFTYKYSGLLPWNKDFMLKDAFPDSPYFGPGKRARKREEPKRESSSKAKGAKKQGAGEPEGKS
jgi:hypothetical protein